MKILFWAAVDLYKPSAERTHVIELSKELANLGCDVGVLCLKVPELEVSGVSFNGFPKFFLHSRIGLRLIHRKLMSAVRKSDVIYIRNGWVGPIIRASKDAGKSYLIELNGVSHVESGSNRGLQYEIDYLSNAKRLIAVSRGIKEFYVSNGLDEKQISVVENGVDTELFVEMDRNKCREGLGLDEKSEVITFVGDFRPWQGIETSIEAMKILSEEVPTARLLLVGDSDGKKFRPSMGDLKKYAASLGIGNNVIFVGRVPQNDVPDYIGASDICIAPFKKGRACSALKVLEYMSCNRPVLTTDIENYKELVEKNRFGLVVEPDDPAALAAAAKTMLGPMKFRKPRKFISENFTWRHTAMKIFDILGDAV